MPTYTPTQYDFMDSFVTAMRSGEYRKIQGALHQFDKSEGDGFCAVGVAYDTAMKKDPLTTMTWAPLPEGFLESGRARWFLSPLNTEDHEAIDNYEITYFGEKVMSDGRLVTAQGREASYFISNSLYTKLRDTDSEFGEYVSRNHSHFQSLGLDGVDESVMWFDSTVVDLNDHGVSLDTIGRIVEDHARLMKLKDAAEAPALPASELVAQVEQREAVSV